VARAPFPHLVALACGALAAFAVGCGDRSHLIPASRADDLVQQLSSLRERIDSGRCDGLDARVKTFHDDATNLSSSVDSRLRRRINDGVAALQKAADRDCQAAADAKTRTETQPTDTTTTETDTTQTQTETTKTETQTQTDTTPSQPSSSEPSSSQPPSTPQPGGTDPGDGGNPAPGTGGVTPGDDGTAGQ
jgi:hypothetical protein